ncbi:ALKBH6 [Mytilus coruscus]|uniref:ALKBH6 n=1 Tax=Mytilus coruscus TaxID=42192 RepID=A0A6J8B646_MYTCO|nr:ALKBH6 [Mytilus coruscus]
MDTNNLVPEAPPTIYYIPEFITPEEEQRLMNSVYAAPKPKWTQLSNRRLQNWGGLPHPKGMVAEDIPQWLKTYIDKIGTLGIFGDCLPNHVLVNEYEAGQGIMPHEDGPLFYPVVSTISLGSHTFLDFYRPISEDTQDSTSFQDRYLTSVLLQPRSLILVCDDMYKTFLHGIEDRTTDHVTDKVVNLSQCEGISIGETLSRKTRISLTIRHVPKTIKNKLIFGKR